MFYCSITVWFSTQSRVSLDRLHCEYVECVMNWDRQVSTSLMVGLICNHIQPVRAMGYRGSCFRVKQLECEVEHSPSSCARF
jgi:hypothetical protein